MGQFDNKRSLFLIICFLLAGTLIYLKPDSTPSLKAGTLNNVLNGLGDWVSVGNSPLDETIADALKVDEYVNNRYKNGNLDVSLYIGYYHSTKKVGAAHDPTVCFPGQGWVLTGKEKHKIILKDGENNAVSYAKMIAELSNEKQLVVYWFQSYDKTSPDTFIQKIYSFINKLTNKGEDNAFVRIITPMNNRSLEECHETIKEFIQSFYPIFIDYVKEDVNK